MMHDESLPRDSGTGMLRCFASGILLFAYLRCSSSLFLLSGQEILYSRSVFEEADKDNAEDRVNNRVGQVSKCSDHVHRIIFYKRRFSFELTLSFLTLL